jgi:HEAT repeat protein
MMRSWRQYLLASAFVALANLSVVACDTPEKQMKSDIEILLHGGDGNDRQQAARRLGQPGNEGGREALEQAAISDMDLDVRRYAIEALERVGSRASVPTLLGIARQEREFLLFASAARALRQIDGTEVIEGVIEIWRSSDRSQQIQRIRDDSLTDVLAAHPALAMPALEPLLRDPLPHLRYLAVEALSQIEPPNLRALLEPLKEDPDEGVRRAVAQALEGAP